MYRLFCICITIGLNFPVNSQNLQGYPLTSSSQAMGLCSISFDDVRAAFANPASIANASNFQSSLFLDQRFAVNELKSISASLLLPTKSGNFAASFNRFGYEVYSENMVQLSYGRKILNNLSIGGAIQYYNVNIQEYGNKSLLGFQLGINTNISKSTSLYFSIQNPHQPEINTEDKLPGFFNLGIQYKPSDIVTLHGELYKELEFNEDFRFGIDYQPLPSLFIRLGGHTYPAQIGFGFGVVVYKSIIIEASSLYHSVLGFSPGLGMSYGIINSK
ncbi:MAG TPA: hypothetical protein VK590_04515 [Saprospiraceae bacterium]|nr:hypothetical protein [Saprospiraceae bacterium]